MFFGMSFAICSATPFNAMQLRHISTPKIYVHESAQMTLKKAFFSALEVLHIHQVAKVMPFNPNLPHTAISQHHHHRRMRRITTKKIR